MPSARLNADPAVETHIIEVEAEGAFGRCHFREEVMPSESNLKTGMPRPPWP